MSDRSKSRVFKHIDLLNIRDMDTNLTIKAERLIEKYIRIVKGKGQVIDNNPTTIDLGASPLEVKEFILHPDSSVENIYEDYYDLSCIISGYSNSISRFQVWVETTSDNGATWDVFPYSGRLQSFSNNLEGDVEFSTKLTLAPHTRFRFRAKVINGEVTLGADTDIDTGLGLVEVPAVTLSIARI